MRLDIDNREIEIRMWIDQCLSKSDIAKRLNCKVDTLDRHLDKLGIEYCGNKSGKGYGKTRVGDYIPYVEYIKGESVQTNKLRKKLLREGLKQYVCECCGNYEWNGQPIPLEVHHVDGNRTHNELSNLQLLCPNCHALTPTYRGKNIKKNNDM